MRPEKISEWYILAFTVICFLFSITLYSNRITYDNFVPLLFICAIFGVMAYLLITRVNLFVGMVGFSLAFVTVCFLSFSHVSLESIFYSLIVIPCIPLFVDKKDLSSLFFCLCSTVAFGIAMKYLIIDAVFNTRLIIFIVFLVISFWYIFIERRRLE